MTNVLNNDRPVFDYEYYKKSADYIQSIIGDFEPEIGMILGTGLGNIANQMEVLCKIPYGDIPNFLVSRAPGHAGQFVVGTLEGKKVICMQGRFHSYDGYHFEQLTIPVRVMKLVGIKKLIVTNAAGGVNKSFKPGDVMIISDHIKLAGSSPMRGPNVDEFGPRFFDVSKAYTPALRKIALDLASETSLNVHEGVYFFMTGPQFETPAEIRAIGILGGDAVGMSTVPEVLCAAQSGIPTLGLSFIANMAAGLQEEVSGEEVEDMARISAPELEKYFKLIVKAL